MAGTHSKIKRDAPPARLTPHEKLRVAFGHLCLDIDQHRLAALYGVNPGRVADAITAVRHAIGDDE